MKAAAYYGREDVRIEAFEAREVGRDEVRVEVAYCGIYGTELHEDERVKSAYFGE